jgi:hypothetical protein
VFLAFFNGQPASNAGNPLMYSGSNWTSSTFLGYLAAMNPRPFSFASASTSSSSPGLMGNATFRANAAKAGLTPNYFITNPEALGGAVVVSNQGKTKYNALQLELRRRLSQGLQFQTSYSFGHEYDTQFTSFRNPLYWSRNTGSPGDITQVFKANVVYDLPFGRGRRFGGNAGGVLDRIISGWQIGWTARLQSGTLVDFGGNIRLVGMTEKDVRDMFKLRFDDAGRQIYMLPQDVIDNTIRAFSVSAISPTGYSGDAPTGRYFAPGNGPDCIETSPTAFGTCGVRELVINGPMFQQHDIRIAKRTPLVGHTNLEFGAQLLNAFNHANFEPVGGVGNQIDDYQVTGLLGQDVARTIQLEIRFNW